MDIFLILCYFRLANKNLISPAEIGSIHDQFTTFVINSPSFINLKSWDPICFWIVNYIFKLLYFWTAFNKITRSPNFSAIY